MAGLLESASAARIGAVVLRRLATFSYEQIRGVEREKLRNAIKSAFFFSEGVRGVIEQLIAGKQVPVATIEKYRRDFTGMPAELQEDLNIFVEIGRQGATRLTIKESDSLLRLFNRKRDLRRDVLDVLRRHSSGHEVSVESLRELLAAIDEFNAALDELDRVLIGRTAK